MLYNTVYDLTQTYLVASIIGISFYFLFTKSYSANHRHRSQYFFYIHTYEYTIQRIFIELHIYNRCLQNIVNLIHIVNSEENNQLSLHSEPRRPIFFHQKDVRQKRLIYNKQI